MIISEKLILFDIACAYNFSQLLDLLSPCMKCYLMRFFTNALHFIYHLTYIEILAIENMVQTFDGRCNIFSKEAT